MEANLTLRWRLESDSLLRFSGFLVSCDMDLPHLFGTILKKQRDNCSHFPIIDNSQESSGVPWGTSVEQVS